MDKNLSLHYEVRESVRARHVRITVHPDGRVVVTKPKRASMRVINAFVQEREEWIRHTVAKFQKQLHAAGGLLPTKLPHPRKGSAAHKEAVARTRVLVRARLEHFNQEYGFLYGTISIRNQKTRWGSCSASGNLSFNYRIGFLPPALADYVIVHELCHVREHNHSARFWALMARAIPDHAARRREIQTRYAL